MYSAIKPNRALQIAALRAWIAQCGARVHVAQILQIIKHIAKGNRRACRMVVLSGDRRVGINM